MIQHFKSIVPLFFNVAVNVHQNIQYLKLPVLAASYRYDVRISSLISSEKQ